MHVVSDLIAADGIHVRVKAFAYVETVLFQRISFPFGKRVNDLDRTVILLFDACLLYTSRCV